MVSGGGRGVTAACVVALAEQTGALFVLLGRTSSRGRGGVARRRSWRRGDQAGAARPRAPRPASRRPRRSWARGRGRSSRRARFAPRWRVSVTSGAAPSTRPWTSRTRLPSRRCWAPSVSAGARSPRSFTVPACSPTSGSRTRRPRTPGGSWRRRSTDSPRSWRPRLPTTCVCCACSRRCRHAMATLARPATPWPTRRSTRSLKPSDAGAARHVSSARSPGARGMAAWSRRLSPHISAPEVWGSSLSRWVRRRSSRSSRRILRSEVEVELSVRATGELPATNHKPARVSVLTGTARQPYLTDHAIDGRVVVPAALALEWFARAAGELWPDRRVDALADFRVLAGVRPGPTELVTIVEQDDGVMGMRSSGGRPAYRCRTASADDHPRLTERLVGEAPPRHAAFPMASASLMGAGRCFTARRFR